MFPACMAFSAMQTGFLHMFHSIGAYPVRVIPMNESRTYLTKRNAKASVLNRIVTLICNFVCRSVFIRILGNEYLGAGGMFGNVFSVLSLCELGFGEAASQSLYKPLADGDTHRIKAILAYYAKVYRYVSFVTLVLSMAVMPFLPVFFSDIGKIDSYRTIYLLFVAHQLLSFYFAPKRALVMCNQRMYAVMSIRTVTSLVMSAAQVFFLLKTGNYAVYIFLRIFFLTLDGFAVNLYADKRYPYISELTVPPNPVSETYKKRVWHNTRSLILHRIGGVINTSTDSILISSRLGLAHMGVYSNYSLIIGSVGSFVSLAVGAASASIGNLGATENAERSERVLRRLCFANFILLTNCAAVFINLLSPAIALWLGRDMCFGLAETAVIVGCFYLSYIRDPVQIFLHSYGVFRSTGKLYLARGLLNLILSLAFVKQYGAVGVFGGTLASTALTALVAEPILLFREAFARPVGSFLREYLSYPLSAAAICAASFAATGFLDAYSIGGAILRGAAVLLFTNATLVVFYGKRYAALVKSLLKLPSNRR